jgi:adenosine deaminase
MAFIGKMLYDSSAGDTDACERVAREVLRTPNTKIDYIQLRFSPWFMAEPHHLDLDAVVEAVVKASLKPNRHRRTRELDRDSQPDLQVETAKKSLEALLLSERIVGLVWRATKRTRHGFTRFHPWARCRLAYHRARRGKWRSRQCGTRCDYSEQNRWSRCAAMEDAALIDFCSKSGSGSKPTLTSNIHTSTVPDLASHPLGDMLKRSCLHH